MAAMLPGRSCPPSYRTRAEDLAEPASRSAETLYVVGGLYGSVAALDAVLDRVAREDAQVDVVFNGDFHYLDVAAARFRRIGESVAAHSATRGNVETELVAEDAAAGCGCAYPAYVPDAVVERSNAVMSRLRQTATALPDVVAPLVGLPGHLVVEVGEVRVAAVHGDPEHLAGWRLALEALEPADEHVRSWTGFQGAATTAGQVADWLDRADVQVLACTHTGLPYMQQSASHGRPGLVVNNGSAGLPSFAGLRAGVLTRISADLTPPEDALYGTELGSVRVDALPVGYDVVRHEQEFLADWPVGSAAHAGYARRLRQGTPLRLHQAARGERVTVARTQP